MKKKRINQPRAKKIKNQYLKSVTSNLLTEQDFIQFAQRMSVVISALAN